jgi:hypothetical protein
VIILVSIVQIVIVQAVTRQRRRGGIDAVPSNMMNPQMLLGRRDPPTPAVVATMDAIALGGYRAAAREPGRVPAVLSCSVRQTEHGVDELPFDRVMRQPHHPPRQLASQRQLRRLDTVAARQVPASDHG